MQVKRNPARIGIFLLGLPIVLLAAAGCEQANRPEQVVAAATFDPTVTFPDSIHATAEGMRTVYNASGTGTYDVGFGPFSAVDYETIDCKDCHAAGGPPRDTCVACHAGNQQNDPNTCYACHSRQKKVDIEKGEADVHRDAGISCVGCHKWNEIHGDGSKPISQFELGEIRVACKDCHVKIKASAAHDAHIDPVTGDSRLACSTCHSRTIVTCYNCHFDTFVAGGGKKAYGALTDWVFLLNGTDGKVKPATYQSIAYEAGPNGDSFIGYGPFEAHTIMSAAETATARPCTACHGTSANSALQDLQANNKITVTWWDSMAAPGSEFKKLSGIVPVVEGKMEYLFMSLDSVAGWSPISTTSVLPDRTQLIYGDFMTAAQVQSMLTGPACTLTSVSPGSGPVAGGTSITLTGTGFWKYSTVTVDGVAATNVVVVNSTTITCDTPAGAGTGAVDVVVTNAPGFTATSTGGFDYQ